MQREQKIIVECIERAGELIERYDANRLRAIKASNVERAQVWAAHVERETAHIARLSGNLAALRGEGAQR